MLSLFVKYLLPLFDVDAGSEMVLVDEATTEVIDLFVRLGRLFTNGADACVLLSFEDTVA